MKSNPVRTYLHERQSNFERELWAAIHEAIHERQDRDHIERTINLDEVTFEELGFPDGIFRWNGEIIVEIEDTRIYKRPLPVHGCQTEFEHHMMELSVKMMVERTNAMVECFTKGFPAKPEKIVIDKQVVPFWNDTIPEAHES